MTITINKIDHPVLFQQTDAGVKTAATKLYDEYHGTKGIAFRDACAAFGEQIETGNLVCVDADGKPLTGTVEENRKAIVTKIYGEMDTPASTLRLWVSQRKVRLTYPKPIREAAEQAALNLSLDHVRALYDEMLKPGGMLAGQTPAQLDNLTALEAGGVVLQLKKAKPAKKSTTTTSESTGIERFEELLSEAFDYAKDDERITAETELTSLFVRVFRLTNKLQADSGLIRYCMGQAAKQSLTGAGFETWHAVVHKLGQDEKAAAAAAGAAGASAGAPADAFGLGASVPADAAEAGV